MFCINVKLIIIACLDVERSAAKSRRIELALAQDFYRAAKADQVEEVGYFQLLRVGDGQVVQNKAVHACFVEAVWRNRKGHSRQCLVGCLSVEKAKGEMFVNEVMFAFNF